MPISPLWQAAAASLSLRGKGRTLCGLYLLPYCVQHINDRAECLRNIKGREGNKYAQPRRIKGCGGNLEGMYGDGIPLVRIGLNVLFEKLSYGADHALCIPVAPSMIYGRNKINVVVLIV